MLIFNYIQNKSNLREECFSILKKFFGEKFFEIIKGIKQEGLQPNKYRE
jgi:hypothetical protein